MSSHRSMELLRDELIRRARGDAAEDQNQILASRRQTVMREIHTDPTPRFPRRLLLPRLALRRRERAHGDEEAGLESPKSPFIPSRRTNTSPVYRTSLAPSSTPGRLPIPRLPIPRPAMVAGSASGNTDTPAETTAPASTAVQRQANKRKKPRRFLFCFPFVKSRHVRIQLAQCFVAAVSLFSLLAVYIGLKLSKHVVIGELNIMLIMIILLAAVFFCYSIIRLWILIVRGNPPDRVPRAMDLRGYAIPRKPIRVVMAQDEEAAGPEDEAMRMNPPAYGLWRESVRVDPNRFFWQRNDTAQPAASPPPTGPRPPSYISEDGVSYVIDAVSRSIAPSSVSDQELVHASERGTAGQPPPS
ncbi:hypothetical protein V8C37DRAFT_119588 [Trichoderma ceciliae]